MTQLSRIALAVAALSLAPIASHAQTLPESSTRRIDSVFAQYTPMTPGCAIGIVREGRTVFEKGYGMSNFEHGVSITPASIFHVASISKQFTAMSIVLLEQDKRLSLDDSIQKWVPEVPSFGATITLRHLLHHTSGLRDWPGTLAVAGWRFDDVISFDQIKRMAMHQHSLNFVPGAEYTYSNTGYNMLAEVVQR
ncbi:MAG: serine hydrolase domain-containing protein, partial [bacterium]